MRQFVTVLAVSTLCLATTACGEGKQTSAPQEEQVQSSKGCNSFTTGTVSLSIKGNPGDSFRIIMSCGNQEVTRCTATVPAGANAATCTNRGPAPASGALSCPVGPGNGNSPAAKVVASGCG